MKKPHITLKVVELCSKCMQNPAEPPHLCPYQEDVEGNHDPEYCTCCVECEKACCDDI